MKEVVYTDPDEMIGWAVDRMPGYGFHSDAKVIGLRDAGTLRGVVVFDHFTPTGCWISVASDGTKRWMTRSFIIHVMAYPFIQLAYPRITAFVSSRNDESLSFCRGFGWVEEGTLREAGLQGEDIVIFGMLRRECRWLPERFAGKVGAARL